MLGVTNGAYAVAAIGAMMSLVDAGRKSREGVRMGLWGAAQAIAFGAGGLVGTIASDIARFVIGSQAAAYATVFTIEALLFLAAAAMAAKLDIRKEQITGHTPTLRETSAVGSAGA